METHVSSTTADVPDTQEVIDSHGNVELVIVVEKLEEDQPQKADSNSQDHVQPMDQDSPLSDQSKKDGLPQNSASKQELLQDAASKESDVGKTLQPLIKIQQAALQTPNKSDVQAQNNKFSKNPESNFAPNTPPKDVMPNHVDVDSTSVKDNILETTEKNKEKELNITIERETSNDSQMETNSDVSEKEHNKSISRELKSLIKSAKESKIINECTKLTGKTRKSRTLDTSNTNLNSSTEAESIRGNRRNSNNSQKSNCSEKSDKVTKRSMRSQNPEFVNKVKQFLNSVTGKFQRTGDSDASLSASDEEMPNKAIENTDSAPCTPKNRNQNSEQTPTKSEENSNKLRSDAYCWRCHWSIDLSDDEKTPQPPLRCTVCPRSFHYRCLTGIERTKVLTKSNWVCPECMTVLHAESSETRSPAMKKTTLGMLCELLKFALQRMTEVNGVEPFMQPVDRSVFPDYDKCVVHPMDLSLMKTQISEGLYGSTESFLADAYWILHNSIIFNALQSKLTAAARALVRSCRAEMAEIEACPECYAAAHARRPTWFTDVCSTPHLVLWAKLKGFPYWPAKAMSVNHAGLVDVRFFGAHDRAWVPARDCFLYSEKDPNNFRTKRQDIIDSMQEAEQHIRNVSRKYGKFVYAPFRTQFEPNKLADQLKMMIPAFEAALESPDRARDRARRSRTPALVMKSRSRSVGPKEGLNLGDDASDTEGSPMDTTKMSDSIDNIKNDSPVEKTLSVTTRKRRRSEVKDGLVATRDSLPKEKRKREGSSSKERDPKNNESQLVSSSKESNKADGEKPVEPMDQLESPECHTSKRNAVLSTPTKPVDSPTLNKDTTKHDLPKGKVDVVIQPIKTISNNIEIKSNETQKTTSQDAKPLTPAVRSSRSNKTSNNNELIEADISSSDSKSANKLDKSPNHPPCLINTNTKSAKETDTLNKTNEKEKEPAPNALNVNNVKGNVKDSSTPNKLNEKVQVPETSTPKKSVEGEKNTQTKNIVKEKVTEPTPPSKNNGKEKVTEMTNDKGKEKSKGAVTSTNKNMVSETENVTAAPVNTKTSKEVPANNPLSKNVGKEKSGEIDITDKTLRVEKVLENSTASKTNSVDKDKSITEKSSTTPKPGCSKAIKSTKERTPCADDVVPVIASRKATRSSASPSTSGSGMPTISSVRSLSAPAQPSPAAARAASTPKTRAPQITVEVSPDSSIFTPTSTDNVRNMKDAVNKLQKLRSGFEQPQVGRVGVRAFARMSSPPEKQAKTNDMLIEIKAEPMDYEESDTAQEATSVLDSLRPRPVAAMSSTNLREVRINKIVAAPTVARKVVKPADVRPRAKKTFPQPRKPDDGRAELTNKNSMVYIPIQPPMSQAPLRPALKSATMPAPRAPALVPTSVNVGVITSMAPPLLPMAPPPPPSLAPPAMSAPAPPPPGSSTITAAAIIGGPSFPTVPTTVHTVPLITSVNGQWTFSLQPVMSVGGVDNITTPLVNGVGERVTSVSASTSSALPPALAPATLAPATLAPAPLTPASSAPASLTSSATAVPPAPPVPALVPTSSPVATVAMATSKTPDAPIGEPPRLQQRPLRSPLAASTPVGDMPPPSAAGPLTAKLNQNAVKLADFFRTLLEDSLEQLDEPQAQATALRLQLEQARWQHQHELAELRHTHELLLVELRAAMEKERTRAVAEARRLAHQELDAAVKNAKSKQWCSNCGQEAQFYCCWNTSYCDYPCQRAHWAQHYGSCTQQRIASVRAASDPAPPTTQDEASKSTTAPSLTVGGKIASRTGNTDQAQKSPIVVSVMDEPSGQKARGASATGAHASSLLANKQAISSEECGGKRMVTSGGYLIVGASTSAMVAPPEPRRAPAPRPAPSPHIEPTKK